MDGDAIDLSVVVPVYNAQDFIERTLGELIDHLARRDDVVELVVVDDGSADETFTLVESIAENAPLSVQLVRLENNGGKGAAIARGMAVACGRFRIFVDADLPFPPEAIDEAMRSLVEGADVVVASRVHSDSKYLVKPSFFRYLYTRHLAGRLFNLIVRVLLLPGIRDSQAGLKGFTADSATALFGGWMPDGFSFDLAILARARHLGLKIAQVPVLFRYDSEPTTVRFLADTAIMMRDLLRVRLRIGGPSFGESGREITAWGRRTVVQTDRSMSRPLGRAITVSACVAALIGLAVFRLWIPNGVLAVGSWLLAITCYVLLARGADFGKETEDPDPPIHRGEPLIFVAILVVTGVLRLWHLDQAPAMVHGDSAECGIQGLHILQGQVGDVFDFSTWYWTPYLAFLPYTVSFATVGLTVLGLRLPSALLGVLCMIPLYLLVRAWMGPRVAQVSTLLFAFSHCATHFSRIGLWNVQTLFLELVAFWLLFRALRSGRMHAAAWAGIVSGLALFSYTAGRLALVMIVGFLILRWMLSRRLELVKILGYVVIGALITATPLLLNYIKWPSVLQEDRTGGVFVLADGNRQHLTQDGRNLTVVEILQNQTVTTLAGFATIGDASGQYGTIQPMLSRLTAAFAVLGFALALWRIRRPEYQFLLSWVVVGLTLSSILIIDPPFHPRLIALFPVPYILAAIALDFLLRPLFARRLAFRLVAAAACFAFIFQSARFDITGYRSYLAKMDALETEWDIIEVFERAGNKHDYYLFGGPTITVPLPALRLFAEGRRVIIGFSSQDVPREITRDTVFIALPGLLERSAPLQNLGPTIGSRFPKTYREVTYSGDQPQLVLYFSSPIGGQSDVIEGQ